MEQTKRINKRINKRKGGTEMNSISKLAVQAQSRPSKKTPKEREAHKVSLLIDHIRKSAEDPSNEAVDIVAPGLLGSRLLEAAAGKVQISGTGELPPNEFKKTPTRKKRTGEFIVVETKLVVVDGKELVCRVLKSGGDYYAGRSQPSGRPPHGTRGLSYTETELKEIQRLRNYLSGRLESTEQFQERNPGALTKGGIDSEDFEDALEQLDGTHDPDQVVDQLDKLHRERK